MKTYIGIDNGTSASIGIIGNNIEMFTMPSFSEQSYTIRKQQITRIDTVALTMLLAPYGEGRVDVLAIIEIPFLNPSMFKTSIAAARALEAVLVVLESLGIPYMYLSAKKWQHELLPSGIKGRAEQKKASKEIGCRLFPTHKEAIIKHKDADGLMISLYGKRNSL